MEFPDILVLFLGPAVVAAALTSYFNLFSSKANRKLTGITEQRAEWRKNIHEIAEKIDESNSITDLRKAVQPLKVIINPFGKKNNDVIVEYDFENFRNDKYIWDAIWFIEHYETSLKLKDRKDNIIFLLSILLKYDWERSKKEIIGLSKNFYLYFSITVIYFINSFLLYRIFKKFDSIDEWIYYIYFSLFIWALSWILKPFSQFLSEKKSFQKIISFYKKINKPCKIFLYFILFIFSVISISYLSHFNFVVYLLEKINTGSLIANISVLVLFIAITVIVFTINFLLNSDPKENNYLVLLNDKNRNILMTQKTQNSK
ncbi:hypothetical protein [Enterococcus sp. AZ102]|uniref:hypothetical protein n=1 Tax=Enterococcus sp. AZ102 TaxID=2774865 RepID=UPI003F2409CD